MREIRTSGSEGGAGRKPRSYLYPKISRRILQSRFYSPLVSNKTILCKTVRQTILMFVDMNTGIHQ